MSDLSQSERERYNEDRVANDEQLQRQCCNLICDDCHSDIDGDRIYCDRCKSVLCVECSTLHCTCDVANGCPCHG